MVRVPSPPPRISGYDDVRPVVGGNSGEVFLARSVATGDDVVVRAYGAGRRRRGPEAPGVHAAVLRRVDGVVPAPRVVELREPARDGEGALLVTTVVPGVVLDDVLKDAAPDLADTLGRSLGEVLGRLTRIPMGGPGDFLDATLENRIWQVGSESLVTWLDRWRGRAPLAALDAHETATLYDACLEADGLLAVAPRACLVHGDLSPRNVLCDPETGVVTGLIDWEFAHAGHPMEDAGHQLRERPGSAFVTAMLGALDAWLPTPERADVETHRRTARAADLYWIIEIASRLGEGSATHTGHRILADIARTGDLLGDLRGQDRARARSTLAH
jgi:aminoglycoside phosphotransferase (APT) family kinase protein